MKTLAFFSVDLPNSDGSEACAFAQFQLIMKKKNQNPHYCNKMIIIAYS